MAAKTTVTKKTVAAKKAAPVKKAAHKAVKKVAPVKKVAATKKVAPVKKVVPPKKAAPTKAAPAKAAPAKKAAPSKPAPTKAAPTKAAPMKKSVAPAKKAAPAKTAAPVKKAAAPVKATVPTKATAATKASAGTKAPAPVKPAAAGKKAEPAATKAAGAKPAVAEAPVVPEAKPIIPIAVPAPKKPGQGKTKAGAKAQTPPVANSISAAKRPSLVVRENETAWTKEELKEVRKALNEDLARLEVELVNAEAGLADLIRDSGDGAGDDQADAGSKTFEREHEMSLANNARDMIVQVKRAMSRLADGTYGVCEVCGNAIGKFRLQAFPRATLCLICKQAEERLSGAI